MNELLKRHWWRHKLYASALSVVPLSEKRMSRKLDSLNLFFVLSTGRAGTKWVSEVLSLVDRAQIVHEPIPMEVHAHMDAIYDAVKAENYVKSVKRKDIFFRVLRHDCDIYGEINGNIRRHIPFLKSYFPKAKFLHLVRDGRNVVRSILARNTFKGNHPVFGSDCPIPSKELRRKWGTMSEFEKACWAWKEENENMRTQITNLARLEDITSSYKAFKVQVLDPLGLSLSEPKWLMYADKKVNESKNNRTRLDEEWTEEQNKIFESICGEEMKALGYH
ncbi:MAG: hypothetical protein ABFS08_02320 [Pseudomonadota bacterium]